MSIESREIEANGLRFHCREAGRGGEPVVLLHGFPETSRVGGRGETTGRGGLPLPRSRSARLQPRGTTGPR